MATKTKWRYQRHGKPVSGTCYHEIYEVSNTGFDELVCNVSDITFVKLILAAPKMYTMLKEMTEQFSHDLNTDYESKLCIEAEKLLTQARGEHDCQHQDVK